MAGRKGLLLIYIKEMVWRIRRRKPTTLETGLFGSRATSVFWAVWGCVTPKAA